MLTASAAKLLHWVEEVVKSFNPVVSSVDTHARDVLGDTESEVRGATVVPQVAQRPHGAAPHRMRTQIVFS